MRPPRMEDAPAVAAMVNVYAPEPFDVLWIEREWTEERFDPERDARITDRAYVAVWDGRGGKAWIDLQGEPSAEMLEWAESRAREKGLVRALGGGWSGNEPVRQLLERAGYRLVRHHYRMRTDLEGVTEAPLWPEGIAVRTFREGDERVFYDVHQETFEDHWEFEREPYDEWGHWMLQPPIYEPDLWFLAEEQGEPAGIAICHRRPEVEGLGWVGILGVRAAWRRRGLGRALMLHAFADFRRRGFGQAGLGVDAESLTGAHRLYESVGMHVSARADTYEKPLT
jgi:mycothiol synthase